MVETQAFDSIMGFRKDPKPRAVSLTEIRGPYYSLVGPRYLADILETMGDLVDSFKFGGGSFALMSRSSVDEMIALCHEHGVLVSTGAFVERVLTQGPRAVDQYIDECARLGFDIIQISTGFIGISLTDVIKLSHRVQRAGLKAKPEIDVQFGAGGGTDTPEELNRFAARDLDWSLRQAERHLEEGAYMIMVQSEGITESVARWRIDVISKIVDRLGLERVMFQAADPRVFSWYITTYGPDVNLFVDHSQIVELETLRAGLWGGSSTWGRVTSYRSTDMSQGNSNDPTGQHPMS